MYFALSYEWGPEEPVERIRLNSIDLTVRRNLYLALAAIRYQLEVVGQNPNGCYFWIDALCIDQGNLLERGHQISLMAGIYSDARFAMTWLGPGLETSLKLLRDFPNNFHKQPGFRAKRQVLSAFINSTYWSRMWIVQEFLLPKKIVFFSEKSLLSWEITESKIDSLLSLHKAHADRQTSKFMFHMLMRKMDREITRFAAQLAPESPEEAMSTFLNFMMSFHENSCSQILDRVYSVLSLVDSWRVPGNCPIPTDYSLEPRELFELIEVHFKTLDLEFFLKVFVHVYNRH